VQAKADSKPNTASIAAINSLFIAIKLSNAKLEKKDQKEFMA
jgi:hypothetical protein